MYASALETVALGKNRKKNSLPVLLVSATYGPTTVAAVVPSGDQVAKNQGAAHSSLMRQFVFGVEMVIITNHGNHS